MESPDRLLSGETVLLAQTPPPTRRSMAGRARKALGGALVPLAGVLVLAALLRLVGLNWDQGQHLHPDERFLIIVGSQLRWPDSPAQYFDFDSSPLNPFRLRDVSFFVYGTLPLFLVKAVASAGQQLARAFDADAVLDSYDRLHLVGRAVSAVFDLGTVAMVFALGRRLFDRRVGLLAALLYSLTVLSIQLAHFFAVDTFSTFFATAALYLLVRACAERRWYLFVGLGAALGFGLASKLSTGLAAPLIIVYAVWRTWAATPPSSAPNRRSRWLGMAACLAGTFAVAALAFKLAQPYAFQGSSILDFRPAKQFLDAVNQQRGIQEGTYDWPPGIQWANTTPFLFPLQNMVVWGLGPALGLASVMAFVYGLYRVLTRPEPAWVALVGWAGINFIYFGGLVLKTMRYLHPIYPVLAVLSAWLVVSLWDASRAPALGRPRRLLRKFPAITFAAVVIGGTAIWAMAFVQIYGRPISRVAASEWIYAAIPPGSRIAVEHWDDALPLRLAGRDPSVYAQISLSLYDDENPEKRVRLLQALDQSDYITLSSNRLSGSITRMPQRYPLATRYYQALFSGELGFDEAAVFTRYPSLLGFEIADDSAEEAFTVYDHPRVRIFRKSPRYNPAVARRLLESVELSGITRTLPRNATPLTLMLSDAELEQVRTTGSFRDIYASTPFTARLPTLSWFAFLFIAGIAAWPIVRLALGRLPDSGYMAAKPFGLLLTFYPVWLLASGNFASFSRSAIAVSALLAVLAGGAVALLTRGSLRRELVQKWPIFVAEECVFVAAFFFLYAVRLGNPDLWHTAFGGEKPMAFAHLNAVIRTDRFPPYDPWWAGGYINYYYFGQLFTAAPAKLMGIVPAVAYNLGLPAMFAFAVGAVFAFGFNVWYAFRRNLVAAVAIGLSAVLFVLAMGNLDTVVQLFQSSAKHVGGAKTVLAVAANLPRTLFGGDFVKDFDFWRSTRVLEQTVNEFPYFTFLYGDLHPHVANFAWALLSLLASFTILLVQPPAGLFEPRLPAAKRVKLVLTSGYLPPVLALAVVLGVHRVTNPWDFPTHLVIGVLASGYAFWRAAGRLAAPVLAGAGLVGASAWVISYVLFLPFHRSFGVFFGGVVRTPQTSALSAYLLMFGGFFLIVLTYAVLAAVPMDLRSRRSAVIFMAIASIVAVTLVFVGDSKASAGIFQLAAMALVATATLKARSRPLVFLPMAFTLGGLLLTAVPEWVALEGDIGRLNTVFKTYFQAWLLFGLAAALLLPQVLPELRRRFTGWLEPLRYLFTIAIVAAVVGPALYPVAATQVKLGLRQFKTPPTLDGLAYMDGALVYDQGRKIELKYDKQAAEWLLANIQGRPVVLEATVNVYRWGSRVSVITGLPTVLGWDWHEKQQRWPYVHQVDARRKDVEAAYGTTDPRRLFEILDRYRVELIYVGALERAYYAPEGIAKFDALLGDRLALLYQNSETKIYKVQRQ